MSIRDRLLVGTGVGVCVALIVSGVLVYMLAKRALVAQFDDGLAAKARAVSLLVEQEGEVIETDDISRDVPVGEYFEIWDGNGKLLLRSKEVMPDGARRVKVSFTPRNEDVEI